MFLLSRPRGAAWWRKRATWSSTLGSWCDVRPAAARQNFQKLIACVPDSWGFFCLFSALNNFYIGCYSGMPAQIHGQKMTYMYS